MRVPAPVLSGCATYTGWQPVVESRNHPNVAMIPQDQTECEMLAKQAGSAGTETAKGVAAGGLRGAAAGCSRVSRAPKGTRACLNCNRGRGHDVIH